LPHNWLYFSVGSLICRDLSRYGAIWTVPYRYKIGLWSGRHYNFAAIVPSCRYRRFFLVRCRLEGTLISQLYYRLDGTLATAKYKCRTFYHSCKLLVESDGLHLAYVHWCTQFSDVVIDCVIKTGRSYSWHSVHFVSGTL